MNRTVVALGDSFSCGGGVGLDIRPEQTWTALVCQALPGAVLVNLSIAGARVRDVRRHQLPAALARQPQLVTIMVGLNDIIRSGLSGEHVGEDLEAVVRPLVEVGAPVLLARWHDPGLILGVSTGLRRALGLRLAMVNQAVDAVADRRPEVALLDLAAVPELTDPGAWAVDGIHPSPAGHRAIALNASRILAGRGLSGLAEPEVVDLLPMPPGPGRTRRARWLASRGLPWLVQHSGRVAPAMLSMAVQAIRDRPPRHPDPALPVGLGSTAEQFACLVDAFDTPNPFDDIGANLARCGDGVVQNSPGTSL